jgi:hypothetical protein
MVDHICSVAIRLRQNWSELMLDKTTPEGLGKDPHLPLTRPTPQLKATTGLRRSKVQSLTTACI